MPGSQIRQRVMKVVKSKARGSKMVKALKSAASKSKLPKKAKK